MCVRRVCVCVCVHCVRVCVCVCVRRVCVCRGGGVCVVQHIQRKRKIFEGIGRPPQEKHNTTGA